MSYKLSKDTWRGTCLFRKWIILRIVKRALKLSSSLIWVSPVCRSSEPSKNGEFEQSMVAKTGEASDSDFDEILTGNSPLGEDSRRITSPFGSKSICLLLGSAIVGLSVLKIIYGQDLTGYYEIWRWVRT